MTTSHVFATLRVILARKRGVRPEALPVTALAEAVGVSRQMVARYEDREGEISATKLSKALERLRADGSLDDADYDAVVSAFCVDRFGRVPRRTRPDDEEGGIAGTILKELKVGELLHTSFPGAGLVEAITGSDDATAVERRIAESVLLAGQCIYEANGTRSYFCKVGRTVHLEAQLSCALGPETWFSMPHRHSRGIQIDFVWGKVRIEGARSKKLELRSFDVAVVPARKTHAVIGVTPRSASLSLLIPTDALLARQLAKHTEIALLSRRA